MSFAANHPVSREQAKVMNRFDITKRMVARLHHDEAVIGGIGYTNFDLWAAGRRPQNFYMLGSMGLAVPIALGRGAGAAEAQGDRAGGRRVDPDAAWFVWPPSPGAGRRTLRS